MEIVYDVYGIASNLATQEANAEEIRRQREEGEKWRGGGEDKSDEVSRISAGNSHQIPLHTQAGLYYLQFAIKIYADNLSAMTMIKTLRRENVRRRIQIILGKENFSPLDDYCGGYVLRGRDIQATIISGEDGIVIGTGSAHGTIPLRYSSKQDDLQRMLSIQKRTVEAVINSHIQLAIKSRHLPSKGLDYRLCVSI